jgi:hypothetical protein
MLSIYRNPVLYYLVVPILIGLWPLLVWSVYLPEAQRRWNQEKDEFKKAQAIMLDILELDPDRLEYADSSNTDHEFDYAIVVDRIASQCGIPPTDYKFSSGPIIKSAGQESQSAKVNLKGIDITTFSRFLSTIKLRWGNLQCTRIKITKKKGLPDAWDADIDFKYYY